MSQLDSWMAKKMQLPLEQLQRQQITQWQLQELNQLLRWCKEHSSYYKAYPAELQSLTELTALPFLDGATIAEQGSRLVCVSQSDISRVVTMQTSGTSGRSKRLYFSEADQQLTVDFFACGLSELHQPGDRCMVWMPGNRPGGMSDLIQRALRTLYVTPVPCDYQATFAETARLLREQQITTMVGSPVQVLSLARYLKHYQLPHTVRAVLVSSDYLSETVRSAITDALGCAVYNHYGITEGGLGFSMECEQHTGLHIRENDLLVEIIDPSTGQVLPDGQWGELVFTTLTRRAMPLIRYRSGDKARILPAPCECGSVVRRMDKIGGRIQQLQQRYCMSALDEALFCLPQLVDYRAQYSAATKKLTLQLLLTEAWTACAAAVRTTVQPMLCCGDTLEVQAEVLTRRNYQTVRSLYPAKRKVWMEGRE